MGYKEVTTFAEYEQATSAPVLSFFNFAIHGGQNYALQAQIMDVVLNSGTEDMVDFYFINEDDAPDIVSNVKAIDDVFTYVFKDGEKVETLRDPDIDDILGILEKYNIVSQ